MGEEQGEGEYRVRQAELVNELSSLRSRVSLANERCSLRSCTYLDSLATLLIAERQEPMVMNTTKKLRKRFQQDRVQQQPGAHLSSSSSSPESSESEENA